MNAFLKKHQRVQKVMEYLEAKNGFIFLLGNKLELDEFSLLLLLLLLLRSSFTFDISIFLVASCLASM